MRIGQIARDKAALRQMGKGLGIGALAGGMAGWLLGRTPPFNPRGRLGPAAILSGIGAMAGSAIGTFIWQLPGSSQPGDQPSARPLRLASVPSQWAPFQEQRIDIPETAEVHAVSKQERQVEAVILHPVVTAHTVTIQDVVRHSEVDIQRGHAGTPDRNAG